MNVRRAVIAAAAALTVCLPAQSFAASKGGGIASKVVRGAGAIGNGMTLYDGARSYCTVGWEIGRRLAIRDGLPDPGAHPGCRKSLRLR